MNLHELETATGQEVFDTIGIHLLKQMRASRAYRAFGACLYRNADGLKCAAGILIGDDEYDRNMEHKSWTQLAGIWKLADGSIITDNHWRLIRDFQNIHDTRDPSEWFYLITSLAIKRGFSVNNIADWRKSCALSRH